MINEILNEAKKHIKNPDWIWNLVDFSVVWFSDKISKLSGYSPEELKKVDLYDVFIWDESETYKFLTIGMQTEGEISAPVKTKNGEIFESTNRYCNFEFNNINYRVGEILKFTKK